MSRTVATSSLPVQSFVFQLAFRWIASIICLVTWNNGFVTGYIQWLSLGT